MPKKNITVLTIAQKAMNDMSSWNERVEEERETLLDNVRHSFLLVIFMAS